MWKKVRLFGSGRGIHAYFCNNSDKKKGEWSFVTFKLSSVFSSTVMIIKSKPVRCSRWIMGAGIEQGWVFFKKSQRQTKTHGRGMTSYDSVSPIFSFPLNHEMSFPPPYTMVLAFF